MDTILEFHDKYLLTPYIYPREWTEDSWTRQYLSLFCIVTLHGYLIYFMIAGLNYFLVFDKRLLQHPLILEVSQQGYDDGQSSETRGGNS